MIRVLSLILLITLCSAQPGTLATYTGVLKPNVFELNLEADDKIEVTITWKSTLSPKTGYDYDLFIYKNGDNLLYNSQASIKKLEEDGTPNPILTV